MEIRPNLASERNDFDHEHEAHARIDQPGDVIQARKAQEQMATLHHTLKQAGFAGLKDAMRVMGRGVGVPRPPVDSLGEVEAGVLTERMHAMKFLEREPRGW